MKITNICLLILIAFASCKGSKSYEAARLTPEGKVTIDESSVVLSRFPQSLTLLTATELMSVVDYKSIVVYDIRSGRITSRLDAAPLFDPSVFDIASFIKKNCTGYFKDRKYVTDINAIKEAEMPFVKVTNVLPSAGMDSVNFIAYVFAPYEKPFVYENKPTTALWLDYWPVLVRANLKTQRITGMTPIVPDTLHNRYYPDLEFGATLLNHKLYTRAIPDDTVKELYEVKTYDPGSQRWSMDTTSQFATEFKDADNWITRTGFQHKGPDIYYNDIFSINMVEKGTAFSLKKLLNYNRHERICSFAVLDADNVVLSTRQKDSADAWVTFYFYNKVNDLLSKPAFTKKSKNISPNILYHDDKVIFISKDDAHYYIETLKITVP